MKFFHLSCIVPASVLHEVMSHLEEMKVRNVAIQHINGAAAEQKDPSEQKETRRKRGTQEGSMTEVIGAWAQGLPQVTVEDIKAELARHGMKPSGASGVINRAMAAKLLKRIGPSTYRAVEKKP